MTNVISASHTCRRLVRIDTCTCAHAAYVYVYTCMHACMSACVYVCMYLRECAYASYVCMHACMHVSLWVCTCYECTILLCYIVCTYVCIHVCMYVFVNCAKKKTTHKSTRARTSCAFWEKYVWETRGIKAEWVLCMYVCTIYRHAWVDKHIDASFEEGHFLGVLPN
jgi:hypothetical protein